MRASQTNNAPEPIPVPLPPPPLSIPLPLPPPPLSLPSPTTAVHRRNSRASSASSSSVSSSSPSQSPAPSPTRGSVVPFSWERHPGVPKSSLAGLISSSSNSGGEPGPLPPPPPPRRCRRIRRRRRLSVDDADPFAAAFVECTREEGTADAEEDKLWPPPPARATASSVHTAGPWRLAAGGGGAAGILAFLDLYGCKSAMDVAGGPFLAPRRRTVAARPGHGHGRAAARR